MRHHSVWGGLLIYNVLPILHSIVLFCFSLLPSSHLSLESIPICPWNVRFVQFIVSLSSFCCVFVVLFLSHILFYLSIHSIVLVFWNRNLEDLKSLLMEDADNMKTFNLIMYEHSTEMLAIAIIHRIIVCVYEVRLQENGRENSLSLLIMSSNWNWMLLDSGWAII